MKFPAIKRQEKNRQIDRSMFRIFEWNFSQTENERGEKKGENRKHTGGFLGNVVE
jgi:hypothetical protein